MSGGVSKNAFPITREGKRWVVRSATGRKLDEARTEKDAQGIQYRLLRDAGMSHVDALEEIR